MSDPVAEFLDAMRSAGVNMDTGSRGGPHPVADGKLHRADALGKKHKKNQHVWYVLHTDSPASGAFGDLQLGVEDTWTEKKPSALTKEERAALKARMAETARARDEERRALNAAATEAAKLILSEKEPAQADHPYLARKGLAPLPGLFRLKKNVRYTIEPGEDPRTARANNLIVPIYRAPRDGEQKSQLVSVQLIREDGEKRFLKGTAKEGSYHPIGKTPKEPGDVILIAEGYATAARVHIATGHFTVAAFDSGNLKPVAVAMRKRYQNATIVICADNDRYTTQPIENPGLTKARESAEAVAGRVAVPMFDDDDTASTDFDDLAQKFGLDRVRGIIGAAIKPPDPDPERAPPHAEAPYDGGYFDDSPPAAFGDDGIPHPLETFGHPHFRCLGVDGTTCFYQPADVAQVIDLTAAQHRAENLMTLAPLQWWEAEFPTKGGVDWKAATNACIRACKLKRKFIPHNSVRGRGAWFERETGVFHAGDHLIVDGSRVTIGQHRSRFVYDEGDAISVDIDHPCNTDEARRFLALCKSLRWASPLSGYLLAGWCVVAPVCGFLRWRPHIWINGQAGSGKSTVMDKIVKAALSASAHSVVGNTSEAGIRGALGMDALPVIFDESEPKDMQNQARIRSILDLARVAASESDGLILKGTSSQRTKGYRARSMFVFASINTQIEGYADETRFTQLTLMQPEVDTEEQRAANKAHFEKLVSDMVALLTPSFAQRLLARTILNLHRLRAYVDVFTAAATLHLGAQRLGDQLGPMLAGAYLLNTTKELTVEEALKWIRGNDWTDHSAKTASRDTERFIQHVTGYIVRNATPEGGTWERTIGELIELAAYAPDVVATPDGMSSERNRKKDSAIPALARLGIRVWRASDGFYVDITTSLEAFKNKVLHGTEWRATNIRQLLKGIEGVQTPKGNRYFAPGVNTPFVTLPINALLKEREPGEDEE